MPEDLQSQPGPGDEPLRHLFSALRSDDEAHVPPFMPHPERRRKKPALPLEWGLAAASILALTVVAAILWPWNEPKHLTPPGRGSAPAVSITEWRPPTDFLLNTPGREILRSAPLITEKPYAGATSPAAARGPRISRAPAPLAQ